MSDPAIDILQTTKDQHRASDPRSSAWVRANAGSGKTHVLAQRVIRLLLAGVPPSKILCLTFTKAAAANMAIRIFETLATWTTLDDDALREAIAKTGAETPASLDFARQLFVRTVETPGGLKVQTIHAFCERLLHLFPFEANVSARFEAMDDRRQGLLLEEARHTVLRNAMQDDVGLSKALSRALAAIADETGFADFEGLLQKTIARKDALALSGGLQTNGLRRRLSEKLGLRPDATLESIAADILDEGLDSARRDEIIATLAASSAKDVALADRLRAALDCDDVVERASAYADCFFNKSDGNPPKNPVTTKIPNAIREDLVAEQTRVTSLRDNLRAVATLERTLALYEVGAAVYGRYAELKTSRGLLDFDDLIERTRTLLTRSAASWILYKLDAGIDHILVDEAQDTSPAQWAILKQLTEEFFAGAGSRPAVRTFFAVGDEKQSIFSFQGAAPREFGSNLALFRKRIEAAELRFEDVELKMSFRSSKTVLDVVDTVFAIDANKAGLTSDNVVPPHLAHKHRLPGYVEFWPLTTAEPLEEPGDWRLPLDVLRAHAPAALMADRVAGKIAALLDPANGHAVHDGDGQMRQVRAGDIMILVRKRGAFFEAVIRALKDRRVAVAGADRLTVSDHIAVMDLLAAARAALLPQDDLTLATVLKSPLVSLDDDDLIKLAPARSGSLFDALRASTEQRHRSACAQVERWIAAARSATPFAFFSMLLGAEGGRRALLARLGPEADDAIDEFQRLALQAPDDGQLTLAQFVAGLEGSGLEIKRDMEGAGDAVRVMTVHAAKGLEAKIVFLPDTCSAPGGGHASSVVDLPVGESGDLLFLWRKSQKNDPAAVATVLAAIRQDEADEHRRLLYVALTRAEERLYIGGFHGAKSLGQETWYGMLSTAFGQSDDFAPIAAGEADGVEGARATGMAARLSGAVAEPAAAPRAPLPDWLSAPAAGERAPPPPLRPSTVLAAADQNDAAPGPGPDRQSARAAIGLAVHELFYRLPGLPETERRATALRYLEVRATALSEPRRRELADNIVAILADPALAELFGPESRGEVAISGTIIAANGQEMPVAGRIDRIAVTPDGVWIADFKTGAARPAAATPAAYVRQMALYRAVLGDLFPGRTVRALMIWTDGPAAVELPSDLLDAELAAVTQSSVHRRAGAP